MRPRLATTANGAVWLAFSAYMDGAFRVVTARAGPGSEENPSVCVVPAEDTRASDLFPSICVGPDQQPWLAWITCSDVQREGVVGRQTGLNCARWDGSVWAPSGAGERFAVTDIDWGMLPVETYWGYNGLRRRPQLAPDAHGVWLFWERHRDERSVADNVANGQLCGRYHDGNRWSSSVLVHDGHSCFSVDSGSLQPDDALVFACKTAPGDSDLDIAFLRRRRSELKPLEEHPKHLWAGWKRVDLPTQVTGPSASHAIACGGETYELLWGDLHCHSYYSPDAEGEPIELLLYARDRGGLDFCCIIDNDHYPEIVMSRSALEYLYAAANGLTGEAFTAFWGYEYTYHPAKGNRFPKNHRAVVCYERDQPLARRYEPSGKTAEDFIATMKGSATLWHAHHEEWDMFGNCQEENAEVCAGWDDYMQAADVVQRHIADGFRFGFTGASDNHRIVPGMGGAVTGLYVRSRDREGIVEALKRRRCYATTGRRLLLDFRVNEHMMGSEMECVGPPRLRLTASSQHELVSVRVLRNEKTIAELHPRARRLEWQYEDSDARAGMQCYRIEVQESGPVRAFPHNIAQANGPRAYSSPIWVRVL